MEEISQYIQIGNGSISSDQIKRIVSEIVQILNKENITYSIANMILDNVKEELSNTVIKIDV